MDKSTINMIKLFIFNQSSSAAVFGIGTYIRELTTALEGCDINVSIIHLLSDKSDVETEEIDGVRQWYIPSPITIITNEVQKDCYYRNIFYLLRLYIVKRENKENIIFHINYLNCKILVDSLSAFFECKIILVVHYLDSIISLLGNISRLHTIISQSDEPSDKVEKFAKESFLKEKEMLQSRRIDKIICLSNNTFDMLHKYYQIEKDRMVVIYNGLSDISAG